MNAPPLARRRLALLAAFSFGGLPLATADSPQTRMQPIGAASAVDRYARPAGDRAVEADRFQETRARLSAQGQPAMRPDGGVRRAVFQQSDRDPVTAPQLPSGGMSFPGATSPSTTPPDVAPPPSGTGGAAAPSPASPPASGPPPSSPGLPRPGAAASDPPSLAPHIPSDGGGDLTPLPQPQLGGGFATIDNCACISAPSSYSAASGIDCGAPAVLPGQPPYNPPPAQIPEPAIMPPPVTPPAPAAATGAPAGALFTLGQERYPVQVGQGLWGQPVAYVPGQHVRNWIRYMSP